MIFKDSKSSLTNLLMSSNRILTFPAILGRLHLSFLSPVPTSTDAKDQQTHTDRLFMVLTLIDLHPDFDLIRRQILANSFVPSLDKVFVCVPRISFTYLIGGSLGSLILVSQATTRGGRSGGGHKGGGRAMRVLQPYGPCTITVICFARRMMSPHLRTSP